jgi:serine/threonine protein phosphatase PrpC
MLIETNTPVEGHPDLREGGEGGVEKHVRSVSNQKRPIGASIFIRAGSIDCDIALEHGFKAQMIKDSIRNWLWAVAEKRSVQIIPESKIYLGTDLGIVRKENQDRVAALKIHPIGGGLPFYCIAVSDGMGGMQDGAACATAALASFFYSIIQHSERPAPEMLKKATVDANNDVHGRWQGKGGATLSAVLLEADGSLHISNVGDSRIYTVGKGWTDIRRVTVDDNLEDAFGGRGRELVQFIGIGKALLPRVDTLPGGLEGLIITSDGAHYFEQRFFEELVAKAGEPIRTGERIIAVSRWLGGPDNATVAAFRVSDVLAALNSKSSLPTIWSGIAQLQFIPPNVVTSSFKADQNEDSPRGHEQTAPLKPTSSKRRIKPTKRPAKEKQQLEINITTDENDDAADR